MIIQGQFIIEFFNISWHRTVCCNSCRFVNKHVIICIHYLFLCSYPVRMKKGGVHNSKACI